MSQRTRQGIIISLFSIIVSLVLVELFLRVVDPLGIKHNFDGGVALNQHTAPDPDLGYTYVPGTYQIQNWTLTIDSSGNRAVPHSAVDAPCTLATIGDSVTFGQGVSDDETWPDLVARELPGITIVNPSKPRYNALNFAPVIRATPADAYIYYAVGNDWVEPATYISPDTPIDFESALQDYLFWSLVELPRQGREPDLSHYIADMGPVLKMKNLLIVTTDEVSFNDLLIQARPDTIVVPPPTHVISKADSHPNPEGHQQIADSVLPHLQAWLPTVCPTK